MSSEVYGAKERVLRSKMGGYMSFLDIFSVMRKELKMMKESILDRVPLVHMQYCEKNSATCLECDTD